MKNFDVVELNLIQQVADSVNVTVNKIYDSTSMFGFKKAVEFEAKYLIYCGLQDINSYLGLPESKFADITDTLYSNNEDRYWLQATASFEEEYK